MGQNASKAASNTASRVVRGAGKADPITGFTRGSMGASPQEEAQRQFLKSQTSTNSSDDDNVNKEMPDDLIKFITDVGPLKKREIKPATVKRADSKNTATTTSTRQSPLFSQVSMEKRIVKEEVEKSSTSTSINNQRKIELMPLAKNIKGFETTRTTNFSHKEDIIDPNDNGLDIIQIYNLLQQNQNNTNNNKLSDLEKHTIKHLGIPILLKDSDDSYVGSWEHNSKQLLQIHRGMIALSNDKVKLVLEDLNETSNSVETNNKKKQISD